MPTYNVVVYCVILCCAVLCCCDHASYKTRALLIHCLHTHTNTQPDIQNTIYIGYGAASTVSDVAVAAAIVVVVA